MQVRWTNVVAMLAVPAFPAAVAPFLSRWHWTLDVLACFPVHAMGWLLAAGTVLCSARRWRTGLACLTGALVAAFAVVPAWCAAPAAAMQGAQLRVLSLNVLRENDEGAAAALAEIAARDPDVVFCSEVTHRWLAKLGAGLAAYPHRCVRADDGWFGVALFSRLPLRDAAVVPMGYEWAPAVRAVVDTPAGPLGMLGVHTPRPGGSRRNHERDRALAALPDVLAPLPRMRIVLGDFNATPWNASFASMLAATELDVLSAGPLQTTWPAPLPSLVRIPIDHVLGGGGVGAETVEIGPCFGSDHRPVFAALRLAAP